jgi:hypothetical protein
VEEAEDVDAEPAASLSRGCGELSSFTTRLSVACCESCNVVAAKRGNIKSMAVLSLGTVTGWCDAGGGGRRAVTTGATCNDDSCETKSSFGFITLVCIGKYKFSPSLSLALVDGRVAVASEAEDVDLFIRIEDDGNSCESNAAS